MILRIRIVIPTFNNPASIGEVVLRALRETPFPIFVIDDGSKDPVQEILRFSAEPEIRAAFAAGRLRTHRFHGNQGKGAAIQYAIRESVGRGFTHLMTIDGDGQHHPTEAMRLAELAKAHPWDLIIGARKFESATVPKISKFGRKFSNHWVGYQTGAVVSDSQSGFRLYPLFRLQHLRFFTRKYDFEIEVLIRLIWAGTTVREVEIDVFYPKPEDRVSHFHKFRDNARISVLNTILIVVSLLKTNRSPGALARAVGIGVLIGTTPFFGAHFLIAGAVVFLFRLNAPALFLGTQISFPPFAPFLIVASVLTGHRILSFFGISAPLEDLPHGIGKEVLNIALHHFGQWLLGSIFVGLALGLVIGLMTYLAARKIRPAGWTGTTRGGKFGNRFLIFVLRTLGLRAAYACVLLIVPYFYLFAPKARRSAQEYWRVIRPESGPVARQFFVLVHLYRFGQVLLDRVYQSLHSEPAFRTRSAGTEKIISIAHEKTGLICVATHAGAWDLAASLLKNRGFRGRLHMVRYHADGLRFDDFKRADAAHLEPVASNAGDQPIFRIREALAAGETVGLMGDRPLGNQFELIPFFGRLAPFDVTPFRLGAACDVPLLYTYGFKSNTERGLYEFFASAEHRYRYEDGAEGRALQCYAWVSEYVASLEGMVEKYPEQWFNFFPFWSTVPVGEKETRSKNHLGEELRRPAPSAAG